jgi:hypothetical protein
MNPYYLLGQVSGKEIDVDPLSTFNPSLQETYGFESIKLEDALDVDFNEQVQLYVIGISTSNIDQVWDALSILVRNKKELIRALLEASLYSINVAFHKLVNTVFEYVDEDMDIDEVVCLTQMLIDAPKTREFEEFLERPVNITPYEEFDVDTLVDEIYKGEWTVQDLIMNVNEHKKMLNDSYVKLEFCDVKYWIYPFYISWSFPTAKLVKQYQATVPIIKPKGILLRRIKDLERELKN